MNVQVRVLDVHSNRVCAVRLSNDTYRLLLMCVYMPYEGSELMTDEFASQLDTVDSTLRSSGYNLLLVPRVRTGFGSRSFSLAAPIIWNSLPLDIRNSSTISCFCRQLKTFHKVAFRPP